MKLLILFILITNISLAQSFSQELDSLLIANTSKQQTGIAVLVVKDNIEIYKKGFGFANIETKIPISASTNFRMASVSKQFTAMCIMLLVKKYKISYEDNLLKFFPDFNKDIGSKIKIKHLLTHTSGIIDYEDFIPKNQKQQLLDSDVLSIIKNHPQCYFEAGTKFQYSNSGFCLLEQIIEKVSNIGFVQFIENNIFKPLSMNNTTIYESKKNISNRAFGYAQNSLGELIFSDQSVTSATKGDGCIYTSLNDYKKWFDCLVTNKLIDLEQEIKKVNYQIEGASNINYGLGWFYALNSQSQLEIYHTGSTCGFSNFVNIIPKKRFLILCFSNISNNHSIEASIRIILKKFNVDESAIDFKSALELTR